MKLSKVEKCARANRKIASINDDSSVCEIISATLRAVLELIKRRSSSISELF